MYFNPRAACGARRRFIASSRILYAFQSTGPVWSPTAIRVGRVLCHTNFNPRTPCGVRLTDITDHLLISGISIHGPRVEPDLNLQKNIVNPKFQSTDPVWSPTGKPYFSGISVRFQSTDPVWSPTLGVVLLFRLFLAFQSTDPVWSPTHKPLENAVESTYFNPRTPCGARHAWRCHMRQQM